MDKGVSNTNGYFGELDYQSTHELNRVFCRKPARDTQQTLHIEDVFYYYLLIVHQNQALFILFISLDHRQVNVGVHIPLRPRKHHHHQRHHHHRRRHRSFTLESKDESGKNLQYSLFLVISVNNIFINRVSCFFFVRGIFRFLCGCL